MCIINGLVTLLTIDALTSNYEYINYKNNNMYLEVFFVWVPVIIIVLLLIPSLYFIYELNFVYDTIYEIKVVGNSWNWLVTLN